MKKILFAAFAVAMMASCGQKTCKTTTATDSIAAADSLQKTFAESDVIGQWTMPDPIDSTKEMGVEIMKEGKAKSINMATLPYSSWEIAADGSTIIIHGKSVGNGQTFDIADTAQVEKGDNDVLKMTLKGTDVVYTKK